MNIAITFAAVLAAAVSAQFSNGLHWVLRPLVFFGLLGYWSYLGVLLYRYRRAHTLARAHDGLVCPYCAYLLTDERKGDRCPECGATCPSAGVAEYWATLASRRGLAPERELRERCGIGPAR